MFDSWIELEDANDESEDLGFLGFLFERDEIAQIRKKIASVDSEVSSVCFV